MSQVNKTSCNIESLTKDELEAEHYNLKKLSSSLTKQVDEYLQQLHETKRQLNTARAMEEHLLSEIETLQIEQSKYNKCSQKLNELEQEIAHLKQENKNLVQMYESQISDKECKIKDMNEKFDSQQKICANSVEKEIDKYEDDIMNLQTQVDSLLHTLNENDMKYNDVIQENTVLTNKISELNNEIEELRQCLTERNHEFYESQETIQNLQDNLVQLQVLIQQLQKEPDKAEKGNSLFAELEDSRQELKKYIQNVNAKYSELRIKYNNKVDEVKNLNLEYAALAKLLEDNKDSAESSAELIEGYKEHISKLTETVNHLEKEVQLRRNVYTNLMSRDMKSVEAFIEMTRKENLALHKKYLTESFAVNVKEEALYETKNEVRKWRATAMQYKAQLLTLKQDIENSKMSKIDPVREFSPEKNYSKKPAKSKPFFDREGKGKNNSSISINDLSNTSISLQPDFDVPAETVEHKFPINTHDISDDFPGYFEDNILESCVLKENNKLFDNANEKRDAKLVSEIKLEVIDEKESVTMGVENIENKIPESKEVKSKRVAFTDAVLEQQSASRPRRGGRLVVVPCVYIPSVKK